METRQTGPPPPVNNALLPDIYNRLDANAIEKTRVVNNQLQARLINQEKTLKKYWKAAERLNRKEQRLVSSDLSRISRTLPAISKINQFNDKFFKKRRSLSDPAMKASQRKGYMEDKGEDVVCQRCYIHHLPLKHRFYQRQRKLSNESVDDMKTISIHRSSVPTIMVEKTKVSSPRPKLLSPIPTTHSPIRTSSPLGSHDILDDENIVLSKIIPTLNQKRGSILLPRISKFQFLERDQIGREKDLNKSLTPRLMPYEDWTQVVRNVSKQLRPKIDKVTPIYSKSRASLRTAGRNRSHSRNYSRRASIVPRPDSFVENKAHTSGSSNRQNDVNDPT